MTMGYTAAAVFIAGSAYAADKNRSAANKAADAAKRQADQQAADAKLLAEQQQAAAAASQAAMIKAESDRNRALAASEAETRRQAADAANASLSDNTPHVQLGAGSADGSGTTAARKRRADFRPEYSSGLTI